LIVELAKALEADADELLLFAWESLHELPAAAPDRGRIRAFRASASRRTVPGNGRMNR
jgi:hypothetical protein